MWRLLPGLLLAVALLPPAAGATDLTFDVLGAVDYDDNVFRRPPGDGGGSKKKPEDDFMFRLRPGVKIHEDRGQDFNYSAKYMLPLEVAAQNSRLDDIDHVALGEVSYHPSDRVEFFASDDFRYLRSTLVNSANNMISSGRDRITHNEAALGGRYRLSPRLNTGVTASHRHWRTTRDDRQDNDTAALTLDGLYVVSSRHQAGFGATYRWQDFQKSENVVSSDAHSVNLFVQWRWQIDETTGLEASVGPSVIRTVQDRFVFRPAGAPAPPFPPPCADTDPQGVCVPQSTDTSVDVFAQLGIIKRWTPTLRTGARYVRSQGTASGVGGSVISDSVVGTVDWEFRERWEATLRGDFTKRESVTSVTRRSGGLSSKLRAERWSVRSRLTHRLARNTRLFGEVLYTDQNSETTLSDASDFRNWIVTLGFTHVFEPIKLF